MQKEDSPGGQGLYYICIEVETIREKNVKVTHNLFSKGFTIYNEEPDQYDQHYIERQVSQKKTERRKLLSSKRATLQPEEPDFKVIRI